MALPSVFRLLLSVLAIIWLFNSLTYAQPFFSRGIILLPPWIQPESPFPNDKIAAHEPNSEQDMPKAEELDTMATESRARELHAPPIRELNDPRRLKKRLGGLPVSPGHDTLFLRPNVHKNITRVHEQAIQDAMLKAKEVHQAVRKLGELALINGSWKPKDRWVHPGFDWIDVFWTFKSSTIIYENTTRADKEAMVKRIQRMEDFEKLGNGSTVSVGRKKIAEEDKRWYGQNFDRVKPLLTPKGAMFIPEDTDFGYQREIWSSINTLARAYGERVSSDPPWDWGDKYGGLLEKMGLGSEF